MDKAQIEAALHQTGVWDPGETFDKAVRDFQKIHGLQQDGVVGPLTLAELFPAPIPDRQGEIRQSHWPHQNQVPTFYGPTGAHQTMVELPWPMYLAWDTGKIVRRISLHEKVAESARRALTRIGEEYGENARDNLGLNLFGGSLNVRKMRGGSSWSMHSWGIAIDFDPERNQLKWGRDKARLAQPDCEAFWSIWEDEGWVSLGRARNYDWMHVQAARI